MRTSKTAIALPPASFTAKLRIWRRPLPRWPRTSSAPAPTPRLTMHRGGNRETEDDDGGRLDLFRGRAVSPAPVFGLRSHHLSESYGIAYRSAFAKQVIDPKAGEH